MRRSSEEVCPPPHREDEIILQPHNDNGPGPQTNERPEPPTNLLQDLPEDKFNEYLGNYPRYIRESYQTYENDRFQNIPDELQSNRPSTTCYFTLLPMDRWIRKRGDLLGQTVHEENTKKIKKNTSKKIERISECAFNQYRNNRSPEQAWISMQILGELKGIDLPRACLLLSVAFPNTVPYCSQALFLQTRGVQDIESDSPMEKTMENYMRIFQRVDGIRSGYDEAYAQAVTAVSAEKVAFVMQCNAEIQAFEKPEIMELLTGHEQDGSGGERVVYKANPSHCQSIKTDADAIAVKKIPLKDPSNDESVVERHRILTEIIVSSRLSTESPEHFVKFHGWFSTKDCCYMAMDYIKYGDLEKNLKSPGELDWQWSEADMKSVAEQILRGLGVMHEHFIAHRDLKPQNILVSSLSSSPLREVRVKIVDFGVSKRLSERLTSFLRTGAGTEGYRAPEVVKAWKQEDGRPNTHYSYNADIWSLGCIIYRMASGSTLFENDTMVANDGRLCKMVGSIEDKLSRGSPGGIHISGTGIQFVKKLIVRKADKQPCVESVMTALQDWTIRPDSPRPQLTGLF
ncbi:kinase-like domain-containing protein [Xylaria digitata]|nr:kinase-like domain-containing protein [Xylaria digitata]